MSIQLQSEYSSLGFVTKYMFDAAAHASLYGVRSSTAAAAVACMHHHIPTCSVVFKTALAAHVLALHPPDLQTAVEEWFGFSSDREHLVTQ